MKTRNPRLRHLRTKIKSLAAEAKFIRCEERKALLHPPKNEYGTGYNQDYEELREHRKGVVGQEARNSLLAYACLRGMPYSAVEPIVRIDYVWSDTHIDGNLPYWPKVRTSALRFGGQEDLVDTWLCNAEQYIASYARKLAA